MLRVFRLDLIFVTVLSCILSLTGCGKEPEDKILLGEWLHMINTEANIDHEPSKIPYLMNVSEEHMYFTDVQRAVEWNVIEESAGFDPNHPLTREWAAYTLINLAGTEVSAADNTIRDIRKSSFPLHMSAAVKAGMFKTDRHDRIEPEKEMDREEAGELLRKTVEFIDRRTFEEPVFSIIWNKDIHTVEDEPELVDLSTMKAYYPAGTSVSPGDVIRYEEDGKLYTFQAEDAEMTDMGTEVELREADPEEIVDSADICHTFEIDFSQAEIIDLPAETFHSYTKTTGISLMSTQRLEKVFQVSGADVAVRLTSAGIAAEVTKALNGGEFRAELNLNHVRPSYRWKLLAGNSEDMYFRIDYESSQKVALHKADGGTLYGDLSAVDPAHFLSSVRSAFRPDESLASVSFPLCTLRVPVPEAPLLNITLQLSLDLSAEGRMELSLSQKGTAGMEIRDGHMRRIADNRHREEAMIHGDLSALVNTSFGFNLENLKLADIRLTAGPVASVDSTVHLYDRNHEHMVIQSDLPADLLNDAARGNPDVFICADIDAFLLMQASYNSPDTLAGKAGLSGSQTILDQDSGSLLPENKKHMENWHFVERCTRGDRLKAARDSEILVTDTIRIADYTLIMDPGESRQIHVTGMPKGYGISNLIYSSDDSSTAYADSSGSVYGKQSGSTIIHIQTADGRYAVSCSVLVRSKNK